MQRKSLIMCNCRGSKPLDWVRLITHSLLIIVLLGFSLYNMTTKGTAVEPIWYAFASLVVGVELDGGYGKMVRRATKNSEIFENSAEESGDDSVRPRSRRGSSVNTIPQSTAEQ